MKIQAGLALVFDMDYDPVDDVLVAGTLGRGAWELTPVANIALPALSIDDRTVAEGNAGPTTATVASSCVPDRAVP